MARRFRLLNSRVIAVVENEWRQLLTNKVVVFTTLVPPMLLVGLALAALFMTDLLANRQLVGGVEAHYSSAGGRGAAWSSVEALEAALLSPFIVLFQMIPLLVPVTIASYSVIGEKQSRSLEALLATPVRTWELLLGKAVAAALPSVISTWYSFAIFALVARFAISERLYKGLIVSPTWLLTIALLTPMLTLLAVSLGIVISSRVRDAQSSQQLGSLVVLPLMAVLIGQVSGALSINVSFVVGTAILVALVDLAALALAVRLFSREAILTTWR